MKPQCRKKSNKFDVAIECHACIILSKHCFATAGYSVELDRHWSCG